MSHDCGSYLPWLRKQQFLFTRLITQPNNIKIVISIVQLFTSKPSESA